MTTRHLAIVGDTHADEHHRFDEHNDVMGWIADDAAARGCSLMLHTGDVYERKSTPRERRCVSVWARGVALHMPLIVIRGNHDEPLDIEALGMLSTIHRVEAITRPGIVNAAGFHVACLPWPTKTHLLAGSPGLSHEQADQAARSALQAILRGMGQDLDVLTAAGPLAREPRIFAGHVMMRGSRVSTGQPPLVGMDLELSVEDLAAVRASLYALGHIHLGQQWHDPPLPVDAMEARISAERLDPGQGSVLLYPGSPRRCNWGEAEPKGYVVATFDDERLVEWHRVETPCAPMLHVEGDYVPAVASEISLQPAGLRLTSHDGVLGDLQRAEVRLRYTVRPEHRAAAKVDVGRLAESMRARGAALVKVEERVLPATRARVPEVATRPSLADKLSAYWDSQGPKAPSAAQRARLVQLLAQLPHPQ
jgi:exonuclease SbcD